MTTLSTEKETKVPKTNGSTQSLQDNGTSGNVNEGFDKRLKNHNDEVQPPDTVHRPTTSDVGVSSHHPDRYDDDIKFIDAERQTRGVQNERHSRNDRYRDSDDDSRDMYKHGANNNDKNFYKGQELILRPPDEVDTPRFPISGDKYDPVFPKIINPSVKIMRIDRNVEDNFNNNHGR